MKAYKLEFRINGKIQRVSTDTDFETIQDRLSEIKEQLFDSNEDYSENLNFEIKVTTE